MLTEKSTTHIDAFEIKLWQGYMFKANELTVFIRRHLMIRLESEVDMILFSFLDISHFLGQLSQRGSCGVP